MLFKCLDLNKELCKPVDKYLSNNRQYSRKNENFDWNYNCHKDG